MKKIEEISLPSELWEKINELVREVKEKVKSSNIEGKLVNIKKQGSVATRTIINPLTTTGKNEIDVDLALVVDNSSISNKRELFDSIKSYLASIFPPENNWEIKDKAISRNFTLYYDSKEIILGLDIVILKLNDNTTHVWNSKDMSWEYSDPFSLIDLFNESKRDNDLLEINKLIKSLRDIKKVQGLKSIFILNSSLKADEITFTSVLNKMLEELSVLNDKGYNTSAANVYDKIIKAKDFNYTSIYRFINELLSYSESDIDSIISQNNNKTNSASKLAGLFGSVHGQQK